MPDRTKIAILGAGSFVFGPGAIHEALVEQRMNRLHLALCDVAREVLDPLAGVGERLAREFGVDVTFSTHLDVDEAIDAADFVVSAVAVDLRRRFAIDREIALRHDPTHLVSEFGGICGISYSLRQVAFMEQLAWSMRRRCPRAMLLTVSNPLPRVCQAATAMGINTVGLCSQSLVAYDMVSRLLDNEPSRYPFERPRQRYELAAAGTNHLSWVVSVRDRRDGRERLPDVLAAVRAGRTSGQARVESLLLETGYLVSSGDDHSKDFLPPDHRVRSSEQAWHGSATERHARIIELREIAEGRRDWHAFLDRVSWEKPMSVIHALIGGPPVDVHALNLPNAGQIDNLPRGAVVETAASVGSRGVVPVACSLPATTVRYTRSAVEVTNAIVAAAMSRRRALLDHAIELDPTIVNKYAARRALAECLQAHADLLPRYE